MRPKGNQASNGEIGVPSHHLSLQPGATESNNNAALWKWDDWLFRTVLYRSTWTTVYINGVPFIGLAVSRDHIRWWSHYAVLVDGSMLTLLTFPVITCRRFGREQTYHREWYTLWVKIKHPRRLFCDNFGKYESILIILIIIVALRSELRLKSVATLTCEIWMLNGTTLHDSYSAQKCDKSFINSKCLYRNVMFWIIYLR